MTMAKPWPMLASAFNATVRQAADALAIERAVTFMNSGTLNFEATVEVHFADDAFGFFDFVGRDRTNV